MRMLAILLILLASVAAAADCPNCHGERIVGPGPVRLPCPVCDGVGALPDPPKAAPAGPQPRPAVVRVTAAVGRERHHGSGVLVQASGTMGLVLTNWHVVREGRDAVSVRWASGTTTPARVQAVDSTWDLAALLVANPPAAPVPIAASPPRIGERLTIAGYGPHGAYLEQTGEVTMFAMPARVRLPQWVEMRGHARNGDSGGPMLNEAGHVAGVLFGAKDGRTVGSMSTRLAAFLAGQECADGRCAQR